MEAVFAAGVDANDPLAGLVVGTRPDPVPAEGSSLVRVHAAGLNHHDLWSLRGVRLWSDQLPMILGTDAAGSMSRPATMSSSTQ